MAETLELTPVLDEETGKYIVKDFNNVRDMVTSYIEKEVNAVIEITDTYALASVKKTRTDIRKKKEAITQARLNINALLLGEFNAQLREIEDLLDGADKELKGKIDSYKEPADKPKLITLVVKGYDEKSLEAVREYAKKLNLYAEVK